MAALPVTWSGRSGLLAPLPTLRVWARPGSHYLRSALPASRPARAAAVSDAAAETHAIAVIEGEAGSELDEEFRGMVGRLAAWKDRYYDCHVPRKVHDEADLGDWVHRVRAQHKRGKLPPAAAAALDALGFAWKVDVVTAKWYHNLHAARQYKEVHGSGEMPPDLSDPTGQHPDWVEAARWLERQRDLYRRQKLLLLRVRLVKEVLGVKMQREHARPRRNMHAFLKQGNERFLAEQAQRHAQQLRQHQQEEEQAAGAGPAAQQAER